MAGVTTTRSSHRSTSSTSEAPWRARSSTTRSWPRTAAARIRRAAGRSSRRRCPDQVRTPRPSRRGTASRRARAPRRPAVSVSPSHRTPGLSSMPSNRSRPGPSGSQSTRSVGARAAPDWATAHASVVAPAPPAPPTIPTMRPGEARSPTSATASTSHSEAADRSTTETAPRVIAARKVVSPGDSPTTCTPSRLGGAREVSTSTTSAPTRTSSAARHEESARDGSAHTSTAAPAAAQSGTTASWTSTDRVMRRTGMPRPSWSPPTAVTGPPRGLCTTPAARHLWTVAGAPRPTRAGAPRHSVAETPSGAAPTVHKLHNEHSSRERMSTGEEHAVHMPYLQRQTSTGPAT